MPGAWQAEHAHAGPPQPDLPKLGREGSVYSHQIKTIDYPERGARFVDKVDDDVLIDAIGRARAFIDPDSAALLIPAARKLQDLTHALLVSRALRIRAHERAAVPGGKIGRFQNFFIGFPQASPGRALRASVRAHGRAAAP